MEISGESRRLTPRGPDQRRFCSKARKVARVAREVEMHCALAFGATGLPWLRVIFEKDESSFCTGDRFLVESLISHF